MPLLKLETSIQVREAEQNALLPALAKALATATGKPEQYVMVTISPGAMPMSMSGKEGPAAFVDVRGIGGLSAEVNRKLSKDICKLLTDTLAIPHDRIYLNFTEIDPANWGWNGSTFG